jgi:hypothetical protein
MLQLFSFRHSIMSFGCTCVSYGDDPTEVEPIAGAAMTEVAQTMRRYGVQTCRKSRVSMISTSSRRSRRSVRIKRAHSRFASRNQRDPSGANTLGRTINIAVYQGSPN